VARWIGPLMPNDSRHGTLQGYEAHRHWEGTPVMCSRCLVARRIMGSAARHLGPKDSARRYALNLTAERWGSS
jgi:hypothetical protein